MPFEATFVGRQSELAELAAHRESTTRSVLSVVATAGMGKTQLVRQYLAGLDEHWKGIFVSLEEVSESNLVVDTVVAACGVTPTGRNDLQRLIRRLTVVHSECIVVVIDNVENFLGVVRDMVEQLVELEHVQVILTSREPLQSGCEQVLRLTPLPKQDGVELLQLLATLRGATVALEDAEDLVETLDALPLAIALAAERTPILSAKQIRERAHSSNRVLRSKELHRHSSLDVALRHSWAHLDDEEQLLCGYLSTFDFSLQIDTVEALWPQLEVQAIASRLAVRSWLSHWRGRSNAKLTMLRAIRSFVREQISEVDRQRARERLSEWMLERIRESRAWWAQHDREGHFVVSMLADRGDVLNAARLMTRLFSGVIHTAHARNLVEQAIVVAGRLRGLDAEHEHRALQSRLSANISNVARTFALSHSAVDWAERAVELAPETEDKLLAVSMLARAQLTERNTDSAARVAQEGMRVLCEEEPTELDEYEACQCLANLSAVFHLTGDPDAALGAIDLALTHATAPALRARLLVHNAHTLFDLGRFTQCARTLDEASSLLANDTVSSKFATLKVLPIYINIAEGRLDIAQTYLDEILVFAHTHDRRAIHYDALQAGASLASARGASPIGFLQRSYHEFALIDGDHVDVARCQTLIALSEIAEGHTAEATQKLRRLAEGASGHLPGEEMATLRMLQASIRFAETVGATGFTDRAQTSADNAFEKDNAFEELVDTALEATASKSLQRFDHALAHFDLARLMIPGFHMFRFEFYVRSWVCAQLDKLDRPCMRVEQGGRAFSIDDKVYDFSMKGMLRRVLLCLAKAATEDPGRYISSQTLAAAVWPEQPEPTRAVLSRAYVAINRLRVKSDVGTYIESTAEGYRMHPSLRVEWVSKMETPRGRKRPS